MDPQYFPFSAIPGGYFDSGTIIPSDESLGIMVPTGHKQFPSILFILNLAYMGRAALADLRIIKCCFCEYTLTKGELKEI